jgi:predicted nucleic acid-binding protein
MNSLYLDTNILIYLLERHEPYSNLVADTLEEYTKTGGTLVTSTITITEFLAGTASSNLTILRKVPKLQLISLDETLAEEAALLQSKTKLQIGDAIHLATALQLHAQYLFTNDKQLAKTAEAHIAVKKL